ncbi:hypothetical protein L6452_38747 [Arctium lappa]|uniref:Uncharacterized protein n=1 Tax=Arctium lappa TaxID=4217 RepID=A0ACB8XRA4_ARCLA|nr:hypothetical protein L6452_38747 [Arctium lappa]
MVVKWRLRPIPVDTGKDKVEESTIEAMVQWATAIAANSLLNKISKRNSESRSSENPSEIQKNRTVI